MADQCISGCLNYNAVAYHANYALDSLHKFSPCEWENCSLKATLRWKHTHLQSSQKSLQGRKIFSSTEIFFLFTVFYNFEKFGTNIQFNVLSLVTGFLMHYEKSSPIDKTLSKTVSWNIQNASYCMCDINIGLIRNIFRNSYNSV